MPSESFAVDTPSRRHARPDRSQALWLFLAAALGLFFLILPLKALFDAPWTGIWPTASSLVTTVAAVTEGSPAARAGLKAGDTLVSLNGRPVSALAYIRDRDYLALWSQDSIFWAERTRLEREIRIGHPLRIGIRRGSDLQEVSLIPEPAAFPAALWRPLPYISIALIFLLVGLLVASRLWTGPTRLNLVDGLAISIVLATLTGYNSRDLAFPVGIHRLLQMANALGVFVMAASTVHFTLTFPRVHPVLRRHPRLPLLLWTGSVLLGCTHFLKLLPGPMLGANLALLIGATGLLVGSLSGAATLQSPLHRRQLKWVLIGVSCGCLPLILLTILPLMFGLPFVPQEYSSAFSVLVPVSLAVSILRWRLAELPLLLSRFLAGSLSLALLVGGGILISRATLAGPYQRYHLLLTSVALALAVLLHQGLKRRLFRLMNGIGGPQEVGIDNVLEHFLGRHARGASVQASLEATLEQRLRFPRLKRNHWLEANASLLSRSLGTSARPVSGEDLGRMLELETEIPAEIEASVFLSIGPDSRVIALGPRWNPDGWTRSDLEILGALTAIAVPLLQAEEARAQAEELRRQQLEQDKLTLELRVEERTRELENTNAKLSQALLAREDFLAAMSHELRTPLATLLGATEALAAGVDGPPTPQMQDRLLTMLRNGRHLRELIGDVLDFARGRAGRLPIQKLPFRLQDVCEEALELVQSSGHHGQSSIDVALPEATLAALGDPLRTRQILTNLLANALVHGGGEVRLELDQHQDQVRLRVLDRGVGIAPHQAALLFKAFERLGRDQHDGAKGTGLGLALSHMLASLMNGSLAYRPRPGGGSCFELCLPWSAVVPEAEPQADPSFEGSPEPGRLILVEDHGELRELLEDYLTSQGWIVEVHERAQGAYDSCRRQLPDILLTDLGLPGISGLELVRMVRALPEAAPLRILVLTGQVMPEDTRQCLEAGADAVLPKPFPLTRLDRVMRELPPRA